MTSFPVDNIAEPIFGIQMGRGFLRNVHDPARCEGQPCVIHNPSDHHMRDWPLNWRGDTRIMERLCEHGIGHPDPDDLEYQKTIEKEWVAIHGCCGCCSRQAS
jgi:hypothetical protein